MWIALLIFCLVILMVSFMLYGISKWQSLIVEKDTEDQSDRLNLRNITPDKRIALWTLIIGLGLFSVVSSIINWVNEIF